MKGYGQPESRKLHGLFWRRLECGLTQVELANKSDVCQKQISRYESHFVVPQGPILNRLAKALNCRPQDLFTRHIEP